MRQFLKDNGLGLVFGLGFLLALAGQALAGHADYNDQQISHGAEPVSLGDYLASSSFGVDVAENWQSEYLQFSLYAVGTVWLVQRGSPESKKPEDIGPESDADQLIGARARAGSPTWAKTGGWRTALYSNSLGVGDGLDLLGRVGGAVGGRLGRVQRRSAQPTTGPHQLGRVPRRSRVLEPDPAELAIRAARRRILRRTGHLPAPARITRVEAGRRAARRHRRQRLTFAVVHRF